MKKTLFALSLLAVCSMAAAQHRQQDKTNSSMLSYPTVNTRTEIILPEVNGYKIIKTDLHVHTFYSDGNISPKYRIIEGWQDGLDAMTISDHIEYRPNEKPMKAFVYMKDDKKADKSKVDNDLNVSVSEAVTEANHYGITLIPGAEITRDPVKIGHFNALFTTDNNLIYNPDPLQSIRNAKKQGAIVQNNHPGWRRSDNNFTPVTEAAIKEGLIDGVEVFNSAEGYPDVIETCIDRNLYICSGSDIHASSHSTYGRYNVYRNMTFVLAKDASLASIREALESRRTLAYAYGDIAGSEQLLIDLFKASIDVKVKYVGAKGDKYVEITNKSSLPYMLDNPVTHVNVILEKFSTISLKFAGDVLPLSVVNMWYGPDKHPVINYNL